MVLRSYGIEPDPIARTYYWAKLEIANAIHTAALDERTALWPAIEAAQEIGSAVRQKVRLVRRTLRATQD